jgi:RNA polymerase sigma-70 factor (ECF subfamily)
VDEFERWLAETYARAYRTACLILRNPADAEEVVQEAYLRVWRFRASLPEGDARRPWLYRVVVNACMSRLRADAHWRDRADDTALEQRAGSDPDPAGAAVAASRAADVLAALAELPEPLRVPVVLRYYSGLSEREIATAIRRRPGTVKSRLSEARRRLSGDPRLAGWHERVNA